MILISCLFSNRFTAGSIFDVMHRGSQYANPILLVPISKLKIDLGLGLQNFTLFLMEKEMDKDYLADLISQRLIPKIDLFYLLIWLHS